jgi:predicted DNA-binding transcriptional regulator AlpA
MSKVSYCEIESGRSAALQGGGTPRRFSDYGFAPRGLRRPAAAHYVGVSPTKFDEWVAERLMPQPKQEGGVVVWDRLELDAAFDLLPERPATAKFNPYAD